MARKVREEEHAARINAILDAAQALIYVKGYAQMTIRDVVDAVGCSKGAFYHYFDSKQALLEVLVDRMVAQIMATMQPILDDPEMSAIVKLETVFGAGVSWKTQRIELLVKLLDVWYGDENAIVRQKLTDKAKTSFHTIYGTILEQGVVEGTMRTDFPEMAGDISMDLVYSMSSRLTQKLVHWDEVDDPRAEVGAVIEAYTDAIERVVGVASGTLHLLDASMFDAWGAALSAEPQLKGSVAMN